MAWRHALLVCMFLVAACGLPEPAPARPTAPPPAPTPLPARAEDAASAFFTAWQQAQYAAMYDLLSADAQAATSRDLFLRRYSNIHDGIGEDEFVARRVARDRTLPKPVLILPSIQVNIRAGHMPPAEADGRVYLKIPVNRI